MIARLSGIYYVAIAGRHTAENIIRELGRVVALIEEHPLAGRSRDEIRLGLRSFAASPHIVFYRVVNSVPEILRVLDGRQDIDEKFSSSEADGGP
jgi:Plasmid stabilization system protein